MSKRIKLAFSLLLYFSIWFLIKPWYGYLLDADAVGYLTVSKRLIQHDYKTAINGLWSPLHSWLISILANKQSNLFNLALYINCFFGAIVLFLSYLFFEFYKIKNSIQNILLLTLAPVLVYYSYVQVFADLPQLAFILLYLYISIQHNFLRSWTLHLLAATCIAIAYYSKAYSIVFFVLHLTFIHGLNYYKNKKFNIKQYVFSIAFCLFLILPWVLALQQKYGTFSLTGNAGKLNMSWYIMSGKLLKPELGHLIPPPYADSPSFWEDPSFSQEKLVGPFTSSTTFLKWLMRVLHTCFTAVICINEISALCLVILLGATYWYFVKRRSFSSEQILLAAALFIMLGYLAMHIETRYIWLLSIVSMVFGAKFLSNYNFESKSLRLAAALLVSFTYLAYPMYHMEQLRNKGKDNFELAALMQQKNIKGRFTANTYDAGNWWVVAYLSGSQYYTIENFDINPQDLKAEILQDKIDYVLVQRENNTGFYNFPLVCDSNKVLSYKDISIYKTK